MEPLRVLPGQYCERARSSDGYVCRSRRGVPSPYCCVLCGKRHVSIYYRWGTDVVKDRPDRVHRLLWIAARYTRGWLTTCTTWIVNEGVKVDTRVKVPAATCIAWFSWRNRINPIGRPLFGTERPMSAVIARKTVAGYAHPSRVPDASNLVYEQIGRAHV